MGRPKKEHVSHNSPTPIWNIPPAPPAPTGPNTPGLLVAAVKGGAVAKDNLPAMLAQAKANGDVDLIEAILDACSR